MRPKKPGSKPIFLLFAVPVLLMASFLYIYIPGHERSFCAIRFGTGVPCPGCGIITSTSLLLNGKIADSLLAHPLGWAVVVWLILLWLKGLTGKETGLKYFSYFLLIGLFVTWILKMGGII